MKKHVLLSLLTTALLWNTASGVEQNELLGAIMKEEYTVVAKLRHKLKELLERQEFEETLAEGNDAYRSFENLAQLLQQMQTHPNALAREALMQALQEFEQHLGDILEQQHTLQEQLPIHEALPAPAQIPLAQFMEALKEMLQQGQFEAAQALLNEMLGMFHRQQNQLRQTLAQYNQKKFEKMNQALSQMVQQTHKALTQEKQVQALLEAFLEAPQLPHNAKEQAVPAQHQVTELTQQMQQLLEQLAASPLLSWEQLQNQLARSQDASQMTLQQIQSGLPQVASKAAQTTQVQLEMLQGQLSDMRQQMQRLMHPQGQSPRRGGQKRFWSEKGVQPLRFEYQFQVDPAYRKAIQTLNQENHLKMTPRQQKYLQDVIK